MYVRVGKQNRSYDLTEIGVKRIFELTADEERIYAATSHGLFYLDGTDIPRQELSDKGKLAGWQKMTTEGSNIVIPSNKGPGLYSRESRCGLRCRDL